MEEQTKTTPNKHGERKEKTMTTVKMGAGGCGIGGFVLFGGALVTATLVSALAIRRKTHRRRRSEDGKGREAIDSPNQLELMMKSSKDREVNKGLSYILSDSSAPNNRSPSSNGGAEINLTDNESDSMLIVDEKSKLVTASGRLNPTKDDDKVLFSKMHEEVHNSRSVDDLGSVSTAEEFRVFDAPSLLGPQIATIEPAEESESVNDSEEKLRMSITEQECKDNGGEMVLEVQKDVIELVHCSAVATQSAEEPVVLIGADREIICSSCSSAERPLLPIEADCLIGYGDQAVSACHEYGFAAEGKEEEENAGDMIGEEAIDAVLGELVAEEAHCVQLSEGQEAPIKVMEGEEQDENIGAAGDTEQKEAEDDSVEGVFVHNNQQVQLEEEATERSEVDEVRIKDSPEVELIIKEEKGAEYGNQKELMGNEGQESKLFSEHKDVVPPIPDSIDAENEDERAEVEDTNVTAVDGNPGNHLIGNEENSEAEAEAEAEAVPLLVEITAAEEPAQMQSYAEDEEVDEEEDKIKEYTEKKSEESSKGTGESSIEPSADAIWSAESINEQKIENPKTGVTTKLQEGIIEEKESSFYSNSKNGDEDEGKIGMSFEELYKMEVPTAQGRLQATEVWRMGKKMRWSFLVPLWCLCHWYFGLPFLKLFLIIVLFIAGILGFPFDIFGRK